MAKGRQRHRVGVQQDIVGPAVVMAFELDDLAPPGVAARKAEGGHAGLGSGVGKAHLVHMRQQADKDFGDLNLNLQCGGEMLSLIHI